MALQNHWEVDESNLLLVPPLTIQPLVENAVRHGILRQLKEGTITNRIVEDEDHAEITVEDNGVGMDRKLH